MYLNILKKDLKRKKAMNVILLVFIILGADDFVLLRENPKVYQCRDGLAFTEDVFLFPVVAL